MAGQGRFRRFLRAYVPELLKEEGVAEVLRKREKERAATEKTYTATVRVTIRAQDEHEAKEILETVRTFGAEVETVEGPDLAEKDDGSES